ncbi:MAG: AAA family ATPase [Candidatus Aenigmatarchaeota archaeon]
MKIALIGTHGTGKTTLVYELTAELKKHGLNATMCTETARRCPLPINRSATFKSQLWMLATQIKEEIEAEKDYEFVVCDRSVLDPFVYTCYVLPDAKEKMWPIVREHLSTYDFLFKTPIIPGYMVKDGVRDTDEGFQRAIDELMDKVLREFHVPHFVLPMSGQLEFIKQKIGLSSILANRRQAAA